MNILWVIAGGLWPVNTGGRQRTLNIISQLATRHRVTLLATHDTGDDPDGLKNRLAHCHRVESFPFKSPKAGSPEFANALFQSWFTKHPVDVWKNRVPALRNEASRILSTEKVDIIVADFVSTTWNVPFHKNVATILFEHNVEYIIWKRLRDVDPKAWRRALLEVEWRKMRRHEARACSQFDLTLGVSDIDCDILRAEAPGANIQSIPTGVDTDYFAPNGWKESATELAFTGSMDWYPNEDGILNFIKTTLPQVRREIPDVTLSVVGRNPTELIKAAASQAGVTVTGTVPDVRPYVGRSAVYVVPLRVGGGTRMKIFEALAMAKPVVSTGIGAEGLPLTHDKHFLRADEPEEFARAVLSLLKDPAKRKSLGLSGRQLVEQHYSWAQVAKVFEAKCEGIISKNAR